MVKNVKKADGHGRQCKVVTQCLSDLQEIPPFAVILKFIKYYKMARFAFKMYLKPGFKDEYKKRHDEIWPELKALIQSTGVSDYSIFLDEETNILFAVQKQKGGQSSQDLGQNPVVQKWWAYMADIMETNPDNSPVTVPMPELFFME